MNDLKPNIQLLLNVANLQSKLFKPVDSQLSVHGINFTELMVMHHLNAATNNCLRRIELAEAVNLTASGVTRMLTPMEKIKLVEKQENPRDARVSLVKLTDTGKTIYADAFVTFQHVCQNLASKLNKQQVKQLNQLITELL